MGYERARDHAVSQNVGKEILNAFLQHNSGNNEAVQHTSSSNQEVEHAHHTHRHHHHTTQKRWVRR